MPTYRVHHLTRYSYEDAVSVCHNLAHLLPRNSARHTWRYADIEISPAPAVRAERLDYFGNRLTFFAIQEPHRELDVITRATVDLEPPPPHHPSASPLFSSPPWELIRDRINTPVMSATADSLAPFASQRPSHFKNPDMLDAFQFTFASPYIRWQTSPNSPASSVSLPPSSDVAIYAAQSFTPNRPILDALHDLTARIHADFKYDTKSTTVSTTLPEIMQARAGVCQDFAHLEIGCLRTLGLPARYVSGYLLTAPPPGPPAPGRGRCLACLAFALPAGFGGRRRGRLARYRPD